MIEEQNLSLLLYLENYVFSNTYEVILLLHRLYFFKNLILMNNFLSIYMYIAK